MDKRKKKADQTKSNQDDLFNKFDKLHKNLKTDKSNIPSQNNNTNKFFVAVLIIIIGASGIFVLIQIPPSSPVIPPPPPGVVPVAGNFYNDTAVSPIYDNSKLTFVYIGGEFCPFCAIERWAIVMALSHYGNFSNLGQITSAEGNIGTYSFVGSSYQSDKINFQPAEILDNVFPKPQALQSMNSLQNQLFSKYSPNGDFPFICIGGTIYQVGLGKPLTENDFSGVSYATIQSQINSKSGKLYTEIVAESQIISSLIDSFS